MVERVQAMGHTVLLAFTETEVRHLVVQPNYCWNINVRCLQHSATGRRIVQWFNTDWKSCLNSHHNPPNQSRFNRRYGMNV